MAEEKKQVVPEGDISIKQVILRLQEWYHYLRHRWLIIIIAGIIGGAIGLIYAMVKKPIYTATLTFALEEKTSGNSLGAYTGLASQFGINLGNGGEGVFTGDNIIELIKSRRMITKAMLSSIRVDGREQSLADYYITFNHLRDNWRKSDNSLADFYFRKNRDSDSLSYKQDSLMGDFYTHLLRNNLTVDKLNKASSIIIISCKSTNQLFAKYFTDSLIQKVATFYTQTKTKRSAINVDILQNRLDSVRIAYNKALYGTAMSIDQNLNSVRAVVNVPSVRNQTEAQILGTEYAELTKNLEIAKMALLQATPLIQIIDRPILPLEKAKVGKLKGLITGAIIFGCLAILLLTLNLLYKRIMVSE